ncbi:MAG TPA: hypothetical protein PKA95_17710, partial [Thermomicrobiales bacterium]|nr:hypothetical protein [Thermomicrobiales bacterium]
RLEPTFGRLEAVWRAASTEEGFEIVRRRLFEPLVDARKHAERDAVIRGFIDLYKANKQDFPNGTSDGPYEERMRAAYPIHPELFDRLFQDWSQLERF